MYFLLIMCYDLKLEQTVGFGPREPCAAHSCLETKNTDGGRGWRFKR